MENEEVRISEDFLIRLKTEVVIKQKITSYRVSLGNGTAYDMHFVPLKRNAFGCLTLLVAINGIGAYTFSEGNYSSCFYVKEKLNITESDSVIISQMINYLLYGRKEVLDV